MTLAANKATLQHMQSALKKITGWPVVIGEPKASPGGFAAAIIPESGYVEAVTLESPREIHVVTVRMYAPMLQEPVEGIEFELDRLRGLVMADYFGDFDFGGTVAYALPTEFSWNYGYQEIGGLMVRLLDISIAYRLDDQATFVA